MFLKIWIKNIMNNYLGHNKLSRKLIQKIVCLGINHMQREDILKQ